jgi:hypothetical protein
MSDDPKNCGIFQFEKSENEIQESDDILDVVVRR